MIEYGHTVLWEEKERGRRNGKATGRNGKVCKFIANEYGPAALR